MNTFYHFFFLCFLSSSSPAAVASRCATVVNGRTYNKCMPLPTQQASLAWTFLPHNDTLDVAFSGSFISPSGWVGWGINPTSAAQMTGTRALVAFSDPNSARLVVLPYILDPTVKLQRGPLLSRPLDLRLLSSSALFRGESLFSSILFFS